MATLPLIPFAADNKYVQQYQKKPQIEGVQVLEVPHFAVEEGDFSEVLRLNETGALERFPEFQLRQINRTRIYPKAIKAWHFHFEQDEFWYVSPNDQLVVGLWDLRQDSPTADVTQKVVLGHGTRNLVYVPRGVAHGCVNLSQRVVNLWYFVNNHFSPENPDENRLHWDARGAEFWQPERD